MRLGEELGRAVLGRLDDAEVILLLNSASYLAADDTVVEMERALERSKQGTAVVVPILLQPCDFEAERFAMLQMLPRDGTPVTMWLHQGEAFAEIAKEIRVAVRARPTKKAPPVEPRGGVDKAEVHPGVEHLFVGRSDEIAELERVLLPGSPMPVAIGALQGMPGVGKSYLADRFAYLHRDRFPGGYAKVSLSPDLPRSAEELAGDLASKVDLPWGGPSRWEQCASAR